MTKSEKIAISLRSSDLSFIDGIAKDKAVGRSAVIRWALDAYRAFLLSQSSTYRILPNDDDPHAVVSEPAN